MLINYLLLINIYLDEYNSKLYFEEVVVKIKSGFFKLVKKN